LSQALALKYRPRRFEDLIGQEAVSRTLALALEQDRLGHAYLFSGLRGSGKTSTARIFAKALLCEKGPTAKPCDTCEQCRMANEGRHIDIIEMDAASSRKIDDIRDLIEHTKYKPSTGRFKIFIVDEVHMLTKEAFNALLKTLEEPPEFVKFILATTDPLKLPATILSRTQHFRFKKIPKPLVISHLEHILNTENVAFEPEALEILARSGGGSLRDTLTLLDQAIVYAKGRVDVATVTQMLGIIDPEFLEKLFDVILRRDETALRSYLKELEAHEAEMVVDEMSLFLKEKLLQNDPRFPPMLLERFYRILADAKPLLALGTDGDFVLSLTLFKLMEALNVKEIDEMIEMLESELSGMPTPQITASPSAPSQNAQPAPKPPTPPKADLKPDNRLRFQKVIEKLYDRNAELGKAFEESIEFVDFNEGTLSWISRADGEHKTLLKNHFGIIRHFVEEVFGIGTKIALVKPPQTAPQNNESDTPAKPVQTATSQTATPQTESSPNDPTPAQNAPDEIPPSGGCVTPTCDTPQQELDAAQLQNDPMVQKAMELFEAKKVIIRSKV